MAKDKDIERFKKDAKAFGISAAGHVPGVGKVLGINDTYKKGKRLAQSAPRAFNAVNKRVRINIKRRFRGL